MTNNAEKQYLDFLRKIKEDGVDRPDRTGTGTRSIFCYTMRFPLSDDALLLTTKKVSYKSIITELLWFLRGDTNNTYLEKHKTTIWREWVKNKEGDLMDIYGKQFRRMVSGNPYLVKKEIRPKEKTSLALLPTEGSPRPFKDIEKDLWNNMLNFNDAQKISESWQSFENFLMDISTLPGYEDWLRFPEEYNLDKDYYGADQFSASTSLFLPLDYKKLKLRYIKNEPEGSSLKDWENVELKLYIDQMKELLKSLKENPSSRRHMLILYSQQDIHAAALPACHSLGQFYVENNKLSFMLYQRSADSLLGVPYNIFSYQLLTMMVAQVLGYELGDFIHNIGDAHIYHNHFPMVEEQLSREIRSPAKVRLNPKVKDLFSFTHEDFIIEGYDPLPAIKAPISV